MNLNDAMRTGLPIAIGGATGRHPDDREDMIEEAVLPALAQAAVIDQLPAAGDVLVSDTDLEPVAEDLPEQSAVAGSLEAEVDAILQRLADIEHRLRERLGLHRIHAALDRVDAMLK